MQSDLQWAVGFRTLLADGGHGDVRIRFGEIPCVLQSCDSQTGPTTFRQLRAHSDLKMLDRLRAVTVRGNNYSVGNTDEGSNMLSAEAILRSAHFLRNIIHCTETCMQHPVATAAEHEAPVNLLFHLERQLGCTKDQR